MHLEQCPSDHFQYLSKENPKLVLPNPGAFHEGCCRLKNRLPLTSSSREVCRLWVLLTIALGLESCKEVSRAQGLWF